MREIGFFWDEFVEVGSVFLALALRVTVRWDSSCDFRFFFGDGILDNNLLFDTCEVVFISFAFSGLMSNDLLGTALFGGGFFVTGLNFFTIDFLLPDCLTSDPDLAIDI